MEEDFWRDQINKLRGPFPEVGIEPPEVEQVTQEPEKELINGINADAIGNFSKITMDVYFFFDTESHRNFMMQAQGMTDYGEITFKKAVQMVQRKQRRNKG